MSKSRGWCFTINNPVLSDCDDLLVAEKNSTYIITGLEVGEQGTDHYQGYVHFKEPVRMTQVKKMLPRAHLEVARGTPDQAIDYCMKDGLYFEDGIRPQQGRRSDLEDIREMLMNGTTPNQIADINFTKWCQYRRAFDEYYKFKIKHDTIVIKYDHYSITEIGYCYKLPNAYVASPYLDEWSVAEEIFSKRHQFVCVPSDKIFYDKLSPVDIVTWLEATGEITAEDDTHVLGFDAPLE